MTGISWKLSGVNPPLHTETSGNYDLSMNISTPSFYVAVFSRGQIASLFAESPDV